MAVSYTHLDVYKRQEFTLTAEDDTQAVVYEGVTYKNERQKVSASVEKKDSVTGEKLDVYKRQVL